MAHAAIVEEEPERLPREMRQIGNDRHQNRLNPLAVERKSKVMMIDDIMSSTWPQDDWDHMSAQESPAFMSLYAPPMGAFRCHLAHADGDLRWSQIKDRDRIQNRFA